MTNKTNQSQNDVRISRVADTTFSTEISVSRQMETSGSAKEIEVSNGGISRKRKPKVTQLGRKFLETYKSQAQANQARMVLKTVDRLLDNYIDINFPEPGIFNDTDGTLGMQWEIGDTTLGIGIDPDIEDSYWFLLSGEQDNDVRAKGSLNKMELLIPWLVYLLEKKQSEIDNKNG